MNTPEHPLTTVIKIETFERENKTKVPQAARSNIEWLSDNKVAVVDADGNRCNDRYTVK